MFKKDMTSLANHFVCLFKVCIIGTLYEILLVFFIASTKNIIFPQYANYLFSFVDKITF